MSFFSKGYGYRDFEQQLPITPQTIFPIASCSKTFAAALTGIATDEGRISLDSPAHQYLPKFKLSSDYLTKHVTVEDLLTHRTGIPGHDWAWTFNTNYSHEEYFKRISNLEASAPLRTKWQYNSFMYLVVSVLNEKLFGMDWNHILKNKLFAPLEMHNSYGGYEVIDNRSNLALTYSYKDSFRLEERLQMDDLEGGGAINSTASDLTHWLIMWINGGTYHDKKVLSGQFVKNAISSHFIISNGLPDKYNDEYFENMGLGWFLSSYRGHYKVQHTGNLSGFSSKLVFYPYDSMGIVILTNQNNSPLIHLIPDFITDLCFQLQPRDQHSTLLEEQKRALLAMSKKQKNNTDQASKRPFHSLASYCGSFYNPGYGHLSIDTLSKRLVLHYAGMKLVLLPEGRDFFSSHYFENGSVADGGVGNVNFTFNKSGKVERVDLPLEPSLKNIVFTKL
ncbi:serine hydrolase [Chitinophagaceae bacterium LB-8]|uniref:Serine hydrolase n=1 Tax=Paraflavisolibacter caeni TaxID=2982496 RepID=A0A9X2XP13_9BACT|nr:serine hydrolase [Paraflavisolibacter caeni]MCU7549644.1 serine hydrolase [Paraflavisolibacter caeni]